MRWLALVWLAACEGPTPEPAPSAPLGPLELPPVDELPEQPDPPDAFVSFRTGEVTGDWDSRREELLVLFQHYVYGFSAASVVATEVERHEDPVGPARLVQLVGSYDAPDGEGRFTVAVWLPEDPVALVLGLNKCGNPSVRDQPLLLDAGGFVQEDCDPEPGSRASYWNIDAALEAGVAVATVHQSDFLPDAAGAEGGLLDAELPDARSSDDRWGAIGIWAWGLSRAVDLLDEETGAVPVVLMGHSRRGKTALWATAQDPRVDGVWAHQSGTGGAALSRHREGETIGAVNTLFPHWFDDVFPAFDGQEARLPIDQHLLLALAAPRPVRITDGDADGWADPEGARQSVELAASTFEVLAAPEPVWALRPGGHEVTGQDWVDAIDWIRGSF